MQNWLLLTGNNSNLDSLLSDFLAPLNIPLNHCLIFEPAETGWSIEQIKDLIQYTKSSFSTPTLFVLKDFNLAKELIQNAFLKTLEEHQKNLGFILAVNSLSGILPTIQSRCEIKQIQNANLKMQNKKEPDSIGTHPASRGEHDVTVFEEILEKAKNKQPYLVSTDLKLSPSKKREQVLEFLEEFLAYCHENLKNDFLLTDKIDKAIQAKKLITNNFLDPEMAVDQVFLG